MAEKKVTMIVAVMIAVLLIFCVVKPLDALEESVTAKVQGEISAELSSWTPDLDIIMNVGSRERYSRIPVNAENAGPHNAGESKWIAALFSVILSMAASRCLEKRKKRRRAGEKVLAHRFYIAILYVHKMDGKKRPLITEIYLIN